MKCLFSLGDPPFALIFILFFFFEKFPFKNLWSILKVMFKKKRGKKKKKKIGYIGFGFINTASVVISVKALPMGPYFRRTVKGSMFVL